jgi:N-acetylmuramoyl-L-alanine amidase CwlA
MHPEMDVNTGYERAALLTAVLSFQNKISVATGIVQHNSWSGKNCPSVLRSQPDGWKNFLAKVKGFRTDLEPVLAGAISFKHND